MDDHAPVCQHARLDAQPLLIRFALKQEGTYPDILPSLSHQYLL